MISIFDRIQANAPGFTKSEKKVASFILAERQNVTNMTILDISQGADVSEASVMRFCNKLGIKKLIDLKIQIAKDSEEAIPKSDDSFTRQEEDYIGIIKNTSSLVDRNSVKQAVDYIEKAQRVSFFGVAASGISAQAGEDSFQRMGKTASAVIDDHFQIMSAASMSEKDVVVALSLSGNTKDICEACILAREKGAKVIAVTSYSKSYLAKISDVVLLTSAKEDIIDGGKITGYVSQLYVLDCLKREYASRNQQAIAELKEVLAKAIIVKKY